MGPIGAAVFNSSGTHVHHINVQIRRDKTLVIKVNYAWISSKRPIPTPGATNRAIELTVKITKL